MRETGDKVINDAAHKTHLSDSCCCLWNSSRGCLCRGGFNGRQTNCWRPRGRFLHGIKLTHRTQVFLPTPRHCEDEGVSPAFGCGNSQLLSASGKRGGDGVSDDSSSALPDAALSRSLTRVSDSGLHPRPPPETLFYGETNSMNGRTAGPFLVLVVRTLSPFGHSRSLFFSPQLI